jgi:NADPH:quinone reductase-like Zn-dependent oxidoreductase
MKAVVYTRYGPPGVLRLMDVETPAPKDDEVLVKVHAVSLNASDWETLRGKPLYSRIMGPFRPRHHILGSDIAGQVETSPNATLFQPGEQVFADILSHMGGFAEYVCVPESALARMPAGMTYEEAACLPQAGAIALQGLLDKGQVQPGQKVLINGAGGGSGMYAVQLAKLYEAEVTGVDNTEKLEFMRSLGADHVIDYTRDDVADGRHRYDVILDIGGNRPVSHLRRALTPRGTIVFVGGESGDRWTGGMGRQIRAVATSPFAQQNVRMFINKERSADLQYLTEFIDAGKITPVIDRTYPLSQTPEAIRYLEDGHARGKIVITV